MGRRGPAPKPTALKVLEGNPGKRALNRETELKPPPGVRPCPGWLNPLAKAEWKLISLELEQVPGLLARVDTMPLAGYCQCVATWQEAQASLDEHGLIYTNPETGVIHARPEVAVRDRALQLMKAFAAEYGFTPSSRSRIHRLPEPEKEDEFERLLS